MDGQLLRPKAEFLAVAKGFVCVRVTDMQAIDLNRYRFDYDLTLAVLFANADGTIYHRYGGRTHDDPLAWMSTGSLLSVMKATLQEHVEYQKKPRPPAARVKHTVYDIDSFRRRMDRKPKRPDCIHCHQIYEAEIRDRQARDEFRMDGIWIWPAPQRVGLRMDPVDQALVASVDKRSPAASAGLREGDRLQRVGDQKILTIADLQWVLEQTPFAGGELPVVFVRDDKSNDATLRLTRGFKRADPLTYSWRSYKWSLQPTPGCGGPVLKPAEKRRLGLDRTKFAFRVNYIVDWGDRPQQGRENRRRGLRKGDVVTAFAGRDEFATMHHFHSWVRLTRKRGEKVVIDVLREGKRRQIRVTLQ